MTTFKLVFNDDIRRITLSTSSWESFVEQLQSIYPTLYHPELKVQYVDDEGDRCTISSQKEWDTMMELLKGQTSAIKLYVVDGTFKGQYFKDGPAPEPVTFYAEQEDGMIFNVSTGDDLKRLEIALPACLQKLFPDEKILPFNIPAWLQPCVKITKLPVPEGEPPVVDLDIDISRLFEILHRQALDLIGAEKTKEELNKAKAYLESMLDIAPSHFITLYNLACVESLLGNAQAAVNSLKQAVSSGYNNLTHMELDRDLDNIRQCVDYKEIVARLRRFVGADQPKKEEPIKEELKEVEPIKEEPKKEAEPVKEEPKKEQKIEEVKKEETVPETRHEEPMKEVEEERKCEEPQISSKWPELHKVLIDMGFDPLLSKEMLDLHRGNLDRAINGLIRLM